jgi:hypothetical protein
MDIQNYTDFLDSANYQRLYSIFAGQGFPWYFYENSVDTIDNSPGVLRHCFVKNGEANSSWVEILEDLFLKISNVLESNITFISIHANLSFPSLADPDSKYPHIDDDNFDEDCYTAIYYLHDCDGDTTLYKQTAKTNQDIPAELTALMTITPEANKLVLWKGNRIHSAPATSSEPRIVLNLNFKAEHV